MKRLIRFGRWIRYATLVAGAIICGAGPFVLIALEWNTWGDVRAPEWTALFASLFSFIVAVFLAAGAVEIEYGKSRS